MKTFIIVLVVSALVCVLFGKPLYDDFKNACNGANSVNIEQAIQSGGLEYDR